MPKRERAYRVLAASMLLVAAPCFAQCGEGVYTFDNLVVFGACSPDGTPKLNVVVLDDTAPLRVSGQVTIPTDRGIDAFAHSGNQLIVLRWDRLEIYDLKDAAHPTLEAGFQLKNQGSVPGYPRIEPSAGGFLVLSSIGAVEIKQQETPAKWILNELPPREEFRRAMQQWPPEHRFDLDEPAPAVLRETQEFRYEFVWRHQTRPGEAISRQYLRKVHKTGGRLQSQLLVRQRYETID